MTPRDKLHLAALRGARGLVLLRAVSGKRRDADCAAFMLGALAVESLNTPQTIEEWKHSASFLIAVNNIVANGYREVLAQLHILEAAEREGVRGRGAEEV